MEPESTVSERTRGAALRVAFSAALVQLALIAGFGNQWFVEFYEKHRPNGAIAQALDPIVLHEWRLTDVADDVRIALIGSAASVVVLVFIFGLLIGWSSAGPRPAWAVFFGVWGATIVASAIGGAIRGFWMYGALFGGRDAPSPYNDKIGWAVGQLRLCAQFGLLYGWFAALLAAGLASAKLRAAQRRAEHAELQAEQTELERERAEREGNRVPQPGDYGTAPGSAAGAAAGGYATVGGYGVQPGQRVPAPLEYQTQAIKLPSATTPEHDTTVMPSGDLTDPPTQVHEAPTTVDGRTRSARTMRHPREMRRRARTSSAAQTWADSYRPPGLIRTAQTWADSYRPDLG